jgi:hypothetical protein
MLTLHQAPPGMTYSVSGAVFSPFKCWAWRRELAAVRQQLGVIYIAANHRRFAERECGLVITAGPNFGRFSRAKRVYVRYSFRLRTERDPLKSGRIDRIHFAEGT